MSAPISMEPGLQALLSTTPRGQADALISLLQRVQAQVGYLSRDQVLAVARHLELPAARVWGVATFYNQFRFTAPGRYHVQVCRGTACHVKGSAAVLEAMEHALGIQDGQTSRDGLFSLETVACIGACGLAPVVKVNETFYGGVGSERAREIVAACRAEAAGEVAHD